MPDSHANFAASTVATAPSPASSGTSLTVAAGQGALFSTPPFNAEVCPAGTAPSAVNAEIVRVTAIATDTLTIVRGPQAGDPGGINRTIVVGDQIFEGPTRKTFTDIEAVLNAPTGGVRTLLVSDGAGGYSWKATTNTPGSPITVGTGPYGVAFSPDGTKAYVVNYGAGNVTPITVATNTPGSPITVGTTPVGVAFSPDGTKAYVANYGAGTVTPITVALALTL